MNDSKEGTLPLDDVMLAMDVVDTLRHRRDLVERELNEDARAASLIEKLRGIYAEQGIEVPDHVLREGVDALAESRFVYTPPRASLGTLLARLYVSRGRWGRAVAVLAVLVIVAYAGWQFAYKPFVASQQAEEARQLSDVLPAEMDALYDTIYRETKVQTAVRQAGDIRERGKSAAIAGDADAAEAAVEDLADIRDTLRAEYRLTVVNREDEASGVWTFPEINTDATNYYIVVEAISPDEEVLTLPVRNEESGEVENVDIFAIRVPQTVYESVEADKLDDGIIQRNIVGVKQFGYLEPDYVMPVLEGAITQW